MADTGANRFLDAKIKRKRKKRKKKTEKVEPGEKVMRKIAKPRKVTAKYQSVITHAVRETRTQVMERYALLPLNQFGQQLDDLYENMDQWDNAERLAGEAVTATNEVHSQAFYRAANEAVGFNMNRFVNEQGLTDILKASVSENVDMLTNLPEKSKRRVASLVNRALVEQTGKTVSLRRSLLEGFTTDVNEAKFIARDQTQRLYKSLNQFRQESLGIEKYKWITSRDGDRVRKTHRANDGKIFRWDKPPKETGHPGHDYNCRCTASAIIKVGPI